MLFWSKYLQHMVNDGKSNCGTTLSDPPYIPFDLSDLLKVLTGFELLHWIIAANPEFDFTVPYGYSLAVQIKSLALQNFDVKSTQQLFAERSLAFQYHLKGSLGLPFLPAFPRDHL